MTANVDPEELLPRPSKAKLQQAFVGKTLHEVSTPAAVVDRAVVRRNCDQLLQACKALQVDFRPHVKTHKVQRSRTNPSLQITYVPEISY